MATFVLVHGSCHGAWCWRDLVPMLAPHASIAIDLPSLGDDQTPAADATLDLNAERICAAAVKADGPVILVGHSAGGYPISAAAQLLGSEKVAHLVYLCAYTPMSGHSMSERRMQADRQPVADAILRAEDGLTYTVQRDRVQDLFYGDCSSEIVEYALAHLRPQPIKPQATPMQVTATLREMPKTYISCQRDGAVPWEFQQVMVQEWPEMAHHALDSDHSPFFSQPDKLAAILRTIGQNS